MSREELKIGDWCRDTINNETFQIEEINGTVYGLIFSRIKR